jgi:hypothetical protein
MKMPATAMEPVLALATLDNVTKIIIKNNPICIALSEEDKTRAPCVAFSEHFRKFIWPIIIYRTDSDLF